MYLLIIHHVSGVTSQSNRLYYLWHEHLRVTEKPHIKVITSRMPGNNKALSFQFAFRRPNGRNERNSKMIFIVTLITHKNDKYYRRESNSFIVNFIWRRRWRATMKKRAKEKGENWSYALTVYTRQRCLLDKLYTFDNNHCAKKKDDHSDYGAQ